MQVAGAGRRVGAIAMGCLGRPAYECRSERAGRKVRRRHPGTPVAVAG